MGILCWSAREEGWAVQKGISLYRKVCRISHLQKVAVLVGMIQRFLAIEYRQICQDLGSH